VNPATSLAGWVISLDLWGTLITHGDRSAAMDWRITEFSRVLDAFGQALPAHRIRSVVISADTAAAQAQRTHGTQPTPDGQVTEILDALGITATTDLLTVLTTVHTHAVLRACPQAAPGAHAALAALVETRARIVLTSNTLSTPGAVHRQLLDDLDLSAYFDDLLFSGDLGIAKPRPEIFTTVAARAAASPDQVVHIGNDWDTDVRGALAAGCRALYYHPHVPAQPDVPSIAHLDQLTDTLLRTVRRRRAGQSPSEPL
jgi:FMN phosphatase YigB (HAD superfamily)